MKKVQFGKIRASRISKYFNNLLYSYRKLNERDTNKVYASQNTSFKLCPIQKCYLISKLYFNAIFHSFSTFFSINHNKIKYLFQNHKYMIYQENDSIS